MEKAHVGGVLTTRKEFKTTRSSPNSMTRLRLSPSETATPSLVSVIWHFLIGPRFAGPPAIIDPSPPLRPRRVEMAEDHDDHDDHDDVRAYAEY